MGCRIKRESKSLRVMENDLERVGQLREADVLSGRGD